MALTTGLATEFAWIIEQGELVTFRIPVLAADGQPFTVDGWTVDTKIKDLRGTVLYAFTSGTWAVSGAFVTLTVLPDVSNAWTFRTARYRVKIQHPTDATQIYRILQGPLYVSID